MKAPVDRSIPPMVTERDGWSVAGAVLLVCVAFGGSYTHVVATVERVSAPGVLAYVIAAMPELSVALATRGLLRGARGLWVWANLATAGAFTLTANLGLGHWAVVAAWPAWSAVAALGLLGAHGQHVVHRAFEQGLGQRAHQLGRHACAAPGVLRNALQHHGEVAAEHRGGVVQRLISTGYLEAAPANSCQRGVQPRQCCCVTL